MSVTAVRRAVLGVLLAGMLAAPAAQATDVTVVGTALTASDPDGTANHLRFQRLPDGRVRVEDLTGRPVNRQVLTCTQQGTTAVHCDALLGDIQSVSAFLGGGNDQSSFADWSTSAPSVSVDGGDGQDLLRAPDVIGFSAVLSGGAQDDELLSTDGNDALHGGGGNDLLRGGAAADGLDGDDGDDTLDGGLGADTIVGGAGSDLLTYAGRITPMVVSLDDAGTEGDGDDVDQVENAEGGDAADSLTGNGGANRLTGGPGADSLSGLGGPDDLRARDDARDTTVNCGDGADSAVADQGDPLVSCETQDLPAAPTLSIGDVAVDETAGTATFTVTKSGLTFGDVTVAFATSDGTAHAPNDYIATSGSLTFTAGQTTRTILVPIVDDALDDTAAQETFTVALSGPSGAVIADGSGTGTITDDDAAPAVSLGNASTAEGGNATFTATLTHASESTLTVKATTADGSATAPADYTATTGTITFTPGATTAPFAVATAQETLFESSETFTATLSEPSTGLTLGAPLTGTATITNDDTAPALSVGATSVAEGGDLVFTLSLSAPSGLPVTLNAATADDTAGAPADYVATSVPVTFTPGSTSRTVTVPTVEDDVDEPAETLKLNATAISGASNTSASGTGTITDDDLPVVSIADTTATEGQPATFTLALVLASTEEVTVRLDTANGTATAPADYTAQTARTVTFAPGQTEATVAVPTADDDIDEDAEAFTATLSEPSGARLATGGGASATATIADGDAAPAATVSGPAAPIAEGDSGTKTATFTVTLSRRSHRGATVRFATADGTATAPADYTATDGTLSFGPTETSKTVDVTFKGDTLDELDETFAVGLALPVPDEGKVVLGTPATATATIDDDDLPTVSVTGGAVGEGGNAAFTVSLGLPAPETATVRLDTSDGSAKAPGDYTAVTNRIVTFDPGETSAVVNVATADDDVDEDGETIVATLSQASGAHLATGGGDTATATIADNDAAPAATVTGPAPVAEGDTGTKTATYTVTLSRRSERGASIRYATANGTATAPADYTAASGTLSFGPTETSKTVDTTVNGDTADEPNETFAVGLALPVPDEGKVALGTPATATTTIADDDLPVASITGGAVGEGGNATFAVSLGLPASETATVRFDTSDGTAKAPGDYTAMTNHVVTFDPGETIVSVDVPTVDDDVDEDGETLTATLSDPQGARLAGGGGSTASATIADNDATPAATVSGPATITEGDSGTTTATFTVTLSRRSERGASVRYATANGTATAPADYAAANGTLSFGPTETSKTAAVAVNGDTLDEPGETFSVGLALPVPDEGKVALGSPATATTTIADDDLPVASITGGAVGEGGNATFTVSLGLAASETATVRFDTSDGTAKAPGDYTAMTNHVVTFDPGETSASVDVPTVDDDVDEDGETLTATLTDPQGARLAGGGGSTASATIADNDAAPVATLAGPPAPITEGDSGTTTATFTVTLSRRSERGAAVRYATTDGTATSPADLTAASGTLPFGPTETTKTFPVDVKGDTEDEPDEGFSASIALPVPDQGRVALGTPVSVATTITDDDLPVVAITSASADEGETVTFGLTLVQASADTVTVQVDTADGSATAPGDYAPLAGGTVTFAPGETAATVAIATVEDDADESDETFTVALSQPSGARLAPGASNATGTIADDETTPAPPPPTPDPPQPAPPAAPVIAAAGDAPAIPACVVPDLRGRTVNDAARLLSQSGCILGKIVRKYQKRGSKAARTRKKNRVYATFPAAGARVARNAPVRVTVSRGVKPRRATKKR